MARAKARTIFEAVRVYGCDWFEPSGLPERPTGVRPGPDKVAVFVARLEAGVELFHPNDAFSTPVTGHAGTSWRFTEPGLRLLAESVLNLRAGSIYGDEDVGIEQRFHGRGQEFSGPNGGRFRDRG